MNVAKHNGRNCYNCTCMRCLCQESTNKNTLNLLRFCACDLAFVPSEEFLREVIHNEMERILMWRADKEADEADALKSAQMSVHQVLRDRVHKQLLQ